MLVSGMPANRRGEANRRAEPIIRAPTRKVPKLALGSKKHKEKGCKKLSRKLTIVLLFAVALSLSLASMAFANGGDDRDNHHEQAKHYKAHLKALNRSGAEGYAILEKEGSKKVETEIHTKGLAPKLPHAQHIHGFKKAVSECPTLAASGSDNLITT